MVYWDALQCHSLRLHDLEPSASKCNTDDQICFTSPSSIDEEDARDTGLDTMTSSDIVQQLYKLYDDTLNTAIRYAACDLLCQPLLR